MYERNVHEQFRFLWIIWTITEDTIFELCLEDGLSTRRWMRIYDVKHQAVSCAWNWGSFHKFWSNELVSVHGAPRCQEPHWSSAMNWPCQHVMQVERHGSIGTQPWALKVQDKRKWFTVLAATSERDQRVHSFEPLCANTIFGEFYISVVHEKFRWADNKV